MRTLPIVALLATVPVALTERDTHRGFNYGALDLNGNVRNQAAFERQFNTAKNLVGYPDAAIGDRTFNSARLYTSIQGGSQNTPISAIPAAIRTNTTLLLGLWCSAGQDIVTREIQALQNAVRMYGKRFTDLVVGISVGSEDIYRITDLGVASNAGPGATGDQIVTYIKQLKSGIAGTALASKKIGHVDTYNVWTNSSRWVQNLINEVDFVGMNAFPYYEGTKDNSIQNANWTFYDDWGKTTDTGKNVWITETGWPVAGPQIHNAYPSVENAQRYWHEIGCHAWNTGINIWWYTLQDPCCSTSQPSFGIVGAGDPPPRKPKFDLTCSGWT